MAAAHKASYEKTCTVCVRTYFSKNAYQNHVGSQKHRAKLAAAEGTTIDEASSVMSSTFSLGEPTTVEESVDSDAEEEFDEVVEGINNANLQGGTAAAGSPSRPHNSAESKKEGSVKTASSATAADEDITLETALKRCLFCNYDSPSIVLNTAHMERVHGMFIPERTYLVQLDGLIGYLYEKITEFHECLYCGKLKPTVFGLQTHMRDKGHCKIPFDTEDQQLEIGEFYDFTSTYSDEEDESGDENELPGAKQSGGVKLGARRQTKLDKDGDENMDGDGWETDSSESSLDSDDLTAVPAGRKHRYEKLNQHPHHAHDDPRPHRNKDGWHSHAHKHTHAVFYSDYELHLPSGRIAGHRSLNRYYRQNLANHPSAAERQEQLAIEANASSEEEQDERAVRRNERERGRALVSRANGGLGMAGVTAEKRKEVQALEKRSRKVAERASRQYQWHVNKQNNSQKHFRWKFAVGEWLQNSSSA
ncbi:hypothetical protein PZA11_005998 [Diplocarpon coronariae]